MSADLGSLPLELLEYEISRHLGFSDLLNLGLTCKAYQHGDVWKRWVKTLPRNILLDDDQLSSFPSLTALYLGPNENITDAGIKSLTALTILSIGGNQKITDEGLSKLTSLTGLSLGWNKNITDRGMEPLTALTDLDLGVNNQITDIGILTKPLTSLQMGLNLKITDKGLPGSLTSLGLGWSKISDAGLSRLTALATLNIGFNCLVTDAGIAPLTKLTTLDVGKNRNISILMSLVILRRKKIHHLD